MGFETAIILGLGFFLALLMFFMYYFSDEHVLLKLFFSIVSMIIGVGLLNIVRIFSEIQSVPNAVLVSALTIMYRVGLWVLYLFFAYIMIYYGIIAFKYLIEWVKPK